MATMQPQPAGPGAAALPQQLSPEQTQQMELVVRQCMQLLLEETTAKMIVAKAQQGDPAQVIAQLVAPLLRQVHASATEAGAQVDMLTMMVAGVQVMALMAKMLEQADVIPDDAAAAQVVAQASKLAVEQHNASVGGAAGGAPGQPAPAGAQPAAAGGMLSQGV